MGKLPSATECVRILTSNTVFRHYERDYEFLEACGICVIAESDLIRLITISEIFDKASIDVSLRPKQGESDNNVNPNEKSGIMLLQLAKESGDPTYTKLLDEYNRRKKEKEERLEKCSKQLGESNG